MAICGGSSLERESAGAALVVLDLIVRSDTAIGMPFSRLGCKLLFLLYLMLLVCWNSRDLHDLTV